METRVNGSHIYFFMEPNIVFVYNIRSLQYITIRNRGRWETFELEDGEPFDTFNHENHKTLGGRGYFLGLDTISQMVGEINQHIHLQRKLASSKSKEETGDYHLVCSEHAAGSLRIGLEWPKTIIAFNDFFSIGPIWKLSEKEGRAFRNEWLSENINVGIEDESDYEVENQFSNTLYEIEDIPDHVPIHIWYGNNVEEQTGMRFILYMLRNKANDIVLHNPVELFRTYNLPEEKEEQALAYTVDIEPENLRFIFEKSKTASPLSSAERKQYEHEWEALSQTKSLLRIWKNNEIQSVSEDYYDLFILKTLTVLHIKEGKKDFIKTGEVVYQVIEEMDRKIGVFFIEYRIRHLIYNGKLELKGIPKSMRHYSVKIKE